VPAVRSGSRSIGVRVFVSTTTAEVDVAAAECEKSSIPRLGTSPMGRSGIDRTARSRVSRLTATPSRSESRRRPDLPRPGLSLRSSLSLPAFADSTARSNPRSAQRKFLPRSQWFHRRTGGPGHRSGPDARRSRCRPTVCDTANAHERLHRRIAGTMLGHLGNGPRFGSSIRLATHRQHRYLPDAGAGPAHCLQRTRRILTRPLRCRSATRQAASRKLRQIRRRPCRRTSDLPVHGQRISLPAVR
jgi:hypothetical protein